MIIRPAGTCFFTEPEPGLGPALTSTYQHGGMALTRRTLLGSAALAGVGTLAGCVNAGRPSGYQPGTPSTPTAAARGLVTAFLTPRPVTLDLGGVMAATWGYADTTPGAVLRATAGDTFRVTVENQLPAETSVHWHGIRLQNAADGVPGLTQEAIAPGGSYTYEFVAPDPGTYFFHPHSGVQLDRGLYAPLIVDDPNEPGGYDHEWIVTLDDWTDGVGQNPDDILAGFQAQNGTVSSGMNHNNMDGGMGHSTDSPLGDAGDVAYPYYLVNGRIPQAPPTFTAKPGQRVRIRFINAGSDTIFRVALGGHTMNVTHTDGFEVERQQTPAFYLAMGERLDVHVTLGDGAFPLVAQAEGKTGRAFAIVRTAGGEAPSATVNLPQFEGRALLATDLRAADSAKLPDRSIDRTFNVELNGQMQPYAWGINGRIFGDDIPMEVLPGERVRMSITNMTMMAHPMHIHGHTWSLPGNGGLRKDTVLVPPMGALAADLEADNPGQWAFHCHNIYHAEIGMMTSLRYR